VTELRRRAPFGARLRRHACAVARRFESFDEAWRTFLARAEPLEWFFGDFPEDEDAVLEGWLVAPSQEVRAAAGRMQARLAHLDWLAPVPDHFLHLWLGERDALGEGGQRIDGPHVRFVEHVQRAFARLRASSHRRVS